jgi:hypothetical protein
MNDDSMAGLTRRRFLITMLAAAAGIGGGSAGLIVLSRRDGSPPYTLTRTEAGDVQIALDPLDEQFDPAPGELTPETEAALLAFAEAFAAGYGSPGSTAHYASYFSWRAENLPGYRGLYEAVGAGLDGLAEADHGVPYAQTDLNWRQGEVAALIAAPTPASALAETRLPLERAEALTAEDTLWLYVSRYLLAEIAVVFMQTNAWIMLGYEGWPGQPRGLDTYTQPLL